MTNCDAGSTGILRQDEGDAAPDSPTMAPMQIKGGSTDYLTLAKNKVADASYVAWKLTRCAPAARAFCIALPVP